MTYPHTLGLPQDSLRQGMQNTPLGGQFPSRTHFQVYLYGVYPPIFRDKPRPLSQARGSENRVSKASQNGIFSGTFIFCTVVALNSGQWAYNDIRPYVIEVTSPIRLSAVPAVD